jgi:hypothetical protein
MAHVWKAQIWCVSSFFGCDTFINFSHIYFKTGTAVIFCTYEQISLHWHFKSFLLVFYLYVILVNLWKLASFMGPNMFTKCCYCFWPIKSLIWLSVNWLVQCFKKYKYVLLFWWLLFHQKIWWFYQHYQLSSAYHKIVMVI